MTRSTRTQTARTHKIRSLMTTTVLAAAGVIGVSSQAFAVDALETPMGGQVVGGQATISTPAAGQLSVNQSTNRAVINWDSFNIGEQATAQFILTQAGGLTVNRVTGNSMNPAQILGTLKSNGTLMILDRNGVLFGAHSRIDVNGIVASTGDVDTAAVMRGDAKLSLTNFGSGSIVNEGEISVADAGLAAFVAPTVVNSGVINAKLGKVALAGAGGDTTATVDLYGDGLVELAPGGSTGKVLAQNSGAINAEGGTVVMTAAAAKEAVDDVVNMSGIIKVSSVTQKGGEIILSGGNGNVKISGAMDASGKTGGGTIKATGRNVAATGTATLAADATDNGEGGSIALLADGVSQFSGIASARGGANGGNGGAMEISGVDGVGFDGLVDTSAALGATGTLLIDPANIMLYNGIGGPLGLLDPYVNAQFMTDTMRFTNVTLSATNSVTVGDNVDLSTWHGLKYVIYGPMVSGINGNNLTLSAPTVNIDHNVILGTGKLKVSATNLNLDGVISTRSTVGGSTTLAGDAALDATGTVNVVSPDALIQQGLSFARSGATVNVGAGTYDEDVVVDKTGINLVGAADNASVITPHSPGIHVTAGGVTVDGFTINGSTVAGILVDSGATNATLKNNVINPASDDGIKLDGADGSFVENNTINDASGNGVTVAQSDNVTVSGNDIKGAGIYGVSVTDSDKASVNNNHNIINPGIAGIYADNATNLDIHQNHVNGGVTGYAVSNSAGALIKSNVAELQSGNGFDVSDSDGVQIVSNRADKTGAAGFNVTGSADAILKANRAYLTGADAFDVSGSNGVQITGNFAGSDNDGVSKGNGNVKGDGIKVTSSDDAVIKGNTIQQTASTGDDIGSGIHVIGGRNAVIGGTDEGEANVVSASGWDNIKLVGTTDATVNGNMLNGAVRTNIYAKNTAGSLIENNTATGANLHNYGAFWIDGGSDATVQANAISNSKTYGILINNATGANLIDDNDIDGILHDGIKARNTDGLTVNDNRIGQNTAGTGVIGGNGITVLGSAGAQVTGNRVGNTGNDGIHAEYSDALTIDGNTVTNAKNDGIFAGFVYGYDYDEETGMVPNVVISNNQVDTTGNNGIEVEDVAFSRITGNSVFNAGQGEAPFSYSYQAKDGILVTNGSEYDDPTEITSNLVDNSRNNGIETDGVDETTITDNTVTRSGQDGIYVYGGQSADIERNTVLIAGRNGIEAYETGNWWWGSEGDVAVSILDNNVAGTGMHGIAAFNTGGLDIEGNTVAITGTDFTDWSFGDEPSPVSYLFRENEEQDSENTEEPSGTQTLTWGYGDGIHVEGAYNYGGPIYALKTEEAPSETVDPLSVLVSGNTVRWTGTDGIFVGDSGATEISGNTVGQTGIESTEFNTADIASVDLEGIIGGVLGQGANPSFGEGGLISWLNDTLPAPVSIGWHVENGDGIRADYDDSVAILENVVDTTGGDGIAASHMYTEGTDPVVTVSGNHVDNSGLNGVEIFNVTHSLIDGNFIGLGEGSVIVNDGILVHTAEEDNEEKFYDPTTISNNLVNGGLNGIEINGVDESSVLSNVVTNAGANGFFASGAGNGSIVLAGNSFTGNTVGAKFESGTTIDLTGETNSFTGGEIGMLFAPFALEEGGFAPMSLADDTAGVPTIGTSIFSGQSQYYIQLANGAFFDPGTPTILNGLNATYDGFSPASTAGVLTQAQYNAIEAKIFHYVDDRTLGLFFFGAVPEDDTSVDEKDLFRVFGSFNPPGGALRVTITGLPNVPGGQANFNIIQTPPTNVANIEPAAGGDDDGSGLNDIEPNAGENTSCWGDAIQGAASGKTVSYSFGFGSGAESLADASSCQSGKL